MLIYIRDSDGNNLGAGPITTATSWESTAALDRAGAYRFEFPAGDLAGTLVAVGRLAHCYEAVNGQMQEVGAGIIETVEKRVTPEGVVLSVGGDDLLRELSYKSVGFLNILDVETQDPVKATYDYEDGGIWHTADMEDTYDNDTSTYHTISDWHVGDYIYVGGSSTLTGVIVTFFYDTYLHSNGSDGTLSAQYYGTGAEWTDCPGLVDGTNAGGHPFGQNGTITWARPDDAVMYTHEGAEAYWVRFSNNAAGDAMDIAEFDVRGDCASTAALSTLIALGTYPSTWALDTTDGYAATGSAVYHAFAGESLLAAFERVADLTGEHFRLGTGREITWLQKDTPDSLCYLVPADMGGGVVTTDDPYRCLIESLTAREDAYELCTRVYPYGRGSGASRQTIAASTDAAESGYTKNTTLNYVQSDTGVATYDVRERVLDFPDVGAIEEGDLHAVEGANALLRAAVEWLKGHDTPTYAYDATVLSGGLDILPGSTVKVLVKEWYSGTEVVDISEDTLICLERSITIDEQGVRVTRLTLATKAEWAKSGVGAVVDQVQDFRRFRGAGEPAATTTTVVTSIASSDVTITGGRIDGTPIGANLESTGRFTTLAAASLAVTNDITVGGDVDGVDVSDFKGAYDLHAAHPAAHHPPVTAADTSLTVTDQAMNVRLNVVSGLEVSTGLRLSSAIAGDGLSMTGCVLDVGAGDGIDVSAGSVAVDVTDLIGAGLIEEVPNNIALRTPGTLSVSTTSSSAGMHTHAITSSSNPGGAARLLASDADGYLQLVRLGAGTVPAYPLHVLGQADIDGLLSLRGTGSSYGITFGPAGALNNLYSDSADVLRTDDHFRAVRLGAGTAPSYPLDVAGTAEITGRLLLPGATNTYGVLIGGDANLYRGAADVLQTDDDFRAARIGSGTAPAHPVDVQGGAPQIVLGPDATNYLGIGVSATGAITLEHGGADATLSTGSPLRLQSAHYASQTTGWGITYAGGADFRTVYANELHTKAFIADLEQALAGGQIITKSVALLGADWSVPAYSAATTITVEPLPGFPATDVFAEGDTLRLRTVSRAAGLAIADCYVTVGTQVSKDATGQVWNVTRLSDPSGGTAVEGTVVYQGAIVLDYGVSGDGFWEVTCLDAAGSPYAQIATWSSTPANATVRARLGQLDGIFGAGSEWGLFAGDYAGGNYLRSSEDGLSIFVGQGNVSLDDDGITINGEQVEYSPQAGMRWTTSAGDIVATLTAGEWGGIDLSSLVLRSNEDADFTAGNIVFETASQNANIWTYLSMQSSTSLGSSLYLETRAGTGSQTCIFRMDAVPSGTRTIALQVDGGAGALLLGASSFASNVAIQGPNVTSGADPGHTHTAYSLTGHNHSHSALTNLTADDHTMYLRTSGLRALTANWDAGSYRIQAQTFYSDVATGTAPYIANSTTVCTNLNANFLQSKSAADFALAGHTHADYLNKNATVGLTANWDVGAYYIRATYFYSDVATGTRPLVCTSTTKCTNLNADRVDDLHASDFATAGHTHTTLGALTTSGAITASYNGAIVAANTTASGNNAEVKWQEAGSNRWSLWYSPSSAPDEWGLYRYVGSAATIFKCWTTNNNILADTTWQDNAWDWVCPACGWHGVEEPEDRVCPRCGGPTEWHDDAALLHLAIHRPEARGLQKLQQLGVMHQDQDGTFICLQNAQMFTWSAVAQLWERLRAAEARVGVLEGRL